MLRLVLPVSLAAVLAACGSAAPQPCLATILPAEVTLAPGDELTFTSSLDGRPGQTQWFTTGGLVDAVGDYTAPTTPGDYTVTVADKTNVDCRAVARVHVVKPDGGTPDAGPADAGP